VRNSQAINIDPNEQEASGPVTSTIISNMKGRSIIAANRDLIVNMTSINT